MFCILAVGMMLTLFGGMAFAGEKVVSAPAIPGEAQLLSLVKPTHPRLLASEGDFATLKLQVATDPQLADWQKKLRKEALAILDQPPARYEIPDGLRLLFTSRKVQDRVYALALAYRLEGDRRYLDRAWTELENAAAFPDWNPRHFLDTAELTHAFAIGYDWLYDAWTPQQRQVLQQAIVSKGFQPALLAYRTGTNGFWVKASHNWNQVCNGGIGMGALALADVEPRLAGEILRDSLQSLPRAMAEFAPDGAWKEGPGYWDYATSYNVVYLAALQSALGTNFGLAQMPGFSDTGLFPLYMTGPTDRTFNYADSPDHRLKAPQLFWLGRQFHQPSCSWYERSTSHPQARDLLWWDPATTGPRAAGLPLDKYFKGAEVVSLRGAWEDSGATFVGFKGGDNKANHSHLDLGSFVLDALGQRWAVDLGGDDYNLPAYFGNKRWTYYRLRAEGHNTLVINPGQSPDQEPAAKAPILRFESKPERAFAIADLTGAYGKQATKVWRGLALLNRKDVVVQDEIQLGASSEVWWFLHTAATAKVADDGRSVMLQQGAARLQARLLAPADGKFQILPAEPLPSSPQPPKQAVNEGTRKLAIHLSGVSNTQIVVLFSPQSAKPTADKNKILPLAQW